MALQALPWIKKAEIISETEDEVAVEITMLPASEGISAGDPNHFANFGLKRIK